MTGETWSTFLSEELDRRNSAGLNRELRSFEREGVYMTTPRGTRLLNFASNDYLGLAGHPLVTEAAARSARRGAGAGASRLVSGTDRATTALEERLAAFQGREAALVFGSGYLANLGLITALASRGDVVIADRLSHASVIDGCRVSSATLFRFRHNDLEALEAALHRAVRQSARRILLVTESVFSMDGDIAPLREIIDLKNRFGAALLLDEAHAEGVFGPNGAGQAHALGLADQVDVHLGTFSKAFGVYGAYIATDAIFHNYLLNLTRTFMFTTALPPQVIGAIDAALDLVVAGDASRSRLAASSASFRSALSQLDCDTSNSETQIIPIITGSNKAATVFARALEESGILACAIRPPTVPNGSARVRFSMSALHEEQEVAALVSSVAQILAVARDAT